MHRNRPIDWMSCAIWAAALVLNFIPWAAVAVIAFSMLRP
jgi:hypothetical protein